VIAIAEIKHVLKTTGESYKADMAPLEKMDVDKFYHETHHDDHHEGGTVTVKHH
jgi:molybdopterin-containing oxidoreductase family membrane subunit